MGLLSWFRGSPKPESNYNQTPTNPNSQSSPSEVSAMNGAVEVPRPAKNVTIFEFGSVAASADKITLAGYCPVSDELEPCRWEILPATEKDAPQFRVVF
ncbi:hypothetical protein K2173_009501 [Erythroxylum novogranatense]|uniref:Allyl alcohol dehydrogenase-like protein n=1 Tax=Erythroxylum novogranatense TaxID=1862640 RepID=A0AAV8U490_9ROSI|nr:hypothetical protein K2173_009501 [Erythroxylum novogranatense]